MLFSMLANLAEDRQGIAAEPGADVSAALKRLKSHDIGVDQVMKLLDKALIVRSEEHTSELQSLMRISYAVFCLKKKKKPDAISCIITDNIITSEHMQL